MTQQKPLWHGIMLVAGGAIGAGMFALPMASAGPWMFWATLGFILVWLMTWCSASLLAKVDLVLVASPDTDIGLNSSFDSLVKHVLGERWALINNACIMFIMMILMYAYTTAGSNIIGYTLESLAVDVPYKRFLSAIFAAVIAITVWLGTTIVSRVTLGLMLAMTLTFCVATVSLVPSVQSGMLVQHTDNLPLLFGALPVYVTAFACAGLVPTLVRHYPQKPQYIFQSLLLGTLIALSIYLFWLAVTLGNIGRAGFLPILSAGGNLSDLVKALVATGADPEMQARLTLFSHCAIITSFLSIGLGLLHFMQDKLKLNETRKQKLLATACAFLPPVIGSIMMPYGFVHAIGFAGLFVAFSFFILPGMLGMKLHRQGLLKEVRPVARASVLFGMLILLLKTMSLLGWLPEYVS